MSDIVSNINDGGPAFPLPCDDPRDFHAVSESGYGGMTLRDYFAANAMQASLFMGTPVNTEAMAKTAYTYADAMIKARQS